MKELLHDTTKFEGHEIPPDNHLSFVINSQGKIKNILKTHNDTGSLTDFFHKKVSLVGCRPWLLLSQTKYTKCSSIIAQLLDYYLMLLVYHCINLLIFLSLFYLRQLLMSLLLKIFLCLLNKLPTPILIMVESLFNISLKKLLKILCERFAFKKVKS